MKASKVLGVLLVALLAIAAVPRSVSAFKVELTDDEQVACAAGDGCRIVTNKDLAELVELAVQLGHEKAAAEARKQCLKGLT